jgi:hypothetical protein
MIRFASLLVLWAAIEGLATVEAQQPLSADDWKRLGRDSLIQRAAVKVRETFPLFRTENFHRTRAFVSDGRVFVRFEQPVKVMPRKGRVVYSVVVELTGGNLASYTDGEGDEDGLIHTPTEEYTRVVRSVFDAINRNRRINEISDFELPSDATMEIEEKSGYYQISVSDHSTYSTYKIRKSSGKIYDDFHKHYAREPLLDGEGKEEEIR